MNIDDFLQQEEFQPLTKKLNEELLRYGGHVMAKEMVDVFGTEEKARRWFYSHIQSLDMARPYDICREGEPEKVFQVLGWIKYGVFG